MTRTVKSHLLTMTLFILLLALECSLAWGQDIVTVTSSGMNDDSLLGIPRRKMVMSETDSEKLWVFHESSAPQAHYSDDGGQTWTGINFYDVGNHDSFDIDSYGNIHSGQRELDGTSTYKRINSPASAIGDYDPDLNHVFSHFSSDGTDMAVLSHENNVWLFTRGSNDSTIYYDVSEDRGATWAKTGIVASGLSTTNRIGAAVINNAPYALIWNHSSPDELLFYTWNGSSFQIDPDFTLTLEISDVLTRIFSVAQTTDGNVHVAYWNYSSGDRIRHVYKKKSDAAWSTPSTVDSCASSGLVCITSHGVDVYIAYLYPQTYNALTYRKFDGATKTYENRVILDDNGDCRYPAFPKNVPAGSSFIPLAWTRGSSLLFSAIPTKPAQQVLGDINNDSTINSGDALLALQISAGLEIGDPLHPPTDEELATGDVNCDGLNNSGDAILILRKVAGLIAEFPCS